MVWDKEVIEVDGNMFVYIRLQNEFTGNISGSFRRIYQDKHGHYYAKADGRNQDLSDVVQRFRAQQIRDKEIRDFYNKYHNQIGGYK